MTTRQQLAAAARAAGERYFEDPRGCKHGHQVFYTSNGSCVRGGRDTAAMIAAEVNLTPGHTRRILLALQADGILACDTHGHTRTWRLK